MFTNSNKNEATKRVLLLSMSTHIPCVLFVCTGPMVNPELTKVKPSISLTECSAHYELIMNNILEFMERILLSTHVTSILLTKKNDKTCMCMIFLGGLTA